MKQRITIFMGFLALSVFTACGNISGVIPGAGYDSRLVGADWRTWGIIDAYGTLTIDGEKLFEKLEP